MVQLVLLILVAEIWNTTGQVLFKKGTNALGKPDLGTFNSYLNFVKKVLSMRTIWLGLCAMTIGLIVWLIALSQGDLSVVFPLGSLQYLLILVASRLVLNEKIDLTKVTGTILVILGVIFIVKS